MTRDEMERRFPRYTRVELTEAGLQSGVCRQQTGTVTGHSAPGSIVGDRLLVLPDGLVGARHYAPEHWQPIPLARLRHEAAIRRRALP